MDRSFTSIIGAIAADPNIDPAFKRGCVMIAHSVEAAGSAAEQAHDAANAAKHTPGPSPDTSAEGWKVESSGLRPGSQYKLVCNGRVYARGDKWGLEYVLRKMGAATPPSSPDVNADMLAALQAIVANGFDMTEGARRAIRLAIARATGKAG